MLLCKKYPFYLLGLLCPFYPKLYLRNAYLRFKIVMLWAIPKPPAPMAKGLSAHLARAGIVAEQPPKIALNWVMIKIAPGQGRVAMAKPATANISLALAILAINTSVPVPATPAVPAPPAAASIPLAPAQAVMNGKTVVARKKSLTAPKVSCIIAMAKLLVYVLQVWASMSQ